MRIVGEQQHPKAKITYYYWNNKYIVKFERGMLEQTFKFSEFDVASEDELRPLIDDEFVEKVVARFDDMATDLAKLTGD